MPKGNQARIPIEEIRAGDYYTKMSATTLRLLAAVLLCLGLRGSGLAASFTLAASDVINTSSFNTAGNWNPVGAPSAGNDYFTGAFTLRSTTNGTPVFAGASLSLDAGGFYSLKSAGAHTVGNFILNGGTIVNGGFGGTGAETGTIAGGMTLQANSTIQVGGGTGSNARSIIINSPIGGAGGLTLTKATGATGATSLTLAGTNSYQGTTSVNGGVLIIRTSSALGGTTNGTIVNGAEGSTGAALQLNAASGTLTINEPLTLAPSATGRAYLDNSSNGNAYNGAIALSGTANPSGFRAHTGTFTVNGNAAGSFNNSFQLRGTATGVLNGDLNIPAASINKTDTGSWTLGDASSSTYAWTGMTVALGTLRMGAAGVMPAGSPVVMGQTDAGAPVFDLNGFDQTVSGLTVAGGGSGTKRVTNNGAAPAVLTVNTAGSMAYGNTQLNTTGALNNGTGVLGLTKAGTGTFTLVGGAITYTGATQVQQGTLVLSDTTAFASDVTTQGTLRLAASAAWNFSRTVDGDGALAKSGAAALTFSGTGNHTGTTTVETGALLLSSGTANNLASSSTLVVNAGATLDVNGLAGGTLDLAGGQTLKGGGTLSGGLIVDLGSILSPGASPGSITTGSETWGAGGIYAFELDLVSTAQVSQDSLAGQNDGHDTVSIAGGLSITATPVNPFEIRVLSLQANDTPGATVNWNPALDYTWRIVSASGISGFTPSSFQINTAGFSAHNAAPGIFSVSADANSVFLNYQAVPEPATGLLLLAGLLALRRRRA